MGKLADKKRMEQELLEENLAPRELTETLFEKYDFNLDKAFKLNLHHAKLIENARIITECLNQYIQGYYYVDYINATFYFENKEDHAIILGLCTAHKIV